MTTQNRRATLLREFEESGLSMAAFSRRRELGYSTLVSWRRAARVEKAKDQDTVPRFVEIEAVMTEPEGRRPAGFGCGRSPETHPAAEALLAELALPGERCCGFSRVPPGPEPWWREECHDLHPWAQSVSGGAAC